MICEFTVSLRHGDDPMLAARIFFRIICTTAERSHNRVATYSAEEWNSDDLALSVPG